MLIDEELCLRARAERDSTWRNYGNSRLGRVSEAISISWTPKPHQRTSNISIGYTVLVYNSSTPSSMCMHIFRRFGANRAVPPAGERKVRRVSAAVRHASMLSRSSRTKMLIPPRFIDGINRRSCRPNLAETPASRAACLQPILRGESPFTQNNRNNSSAPPLK